jgi:hypothetical protein
MVRFHGMKNLDKTKIKIKIKAATLQGSKHPSFSHFNFTGLDDIMERLFWLFALEQAMIQAWKTHHTKCTCPVLNAPRADTPFCL